MSKDKDRYSVLKTRREFIRHAACAAVGTAALTNTIRDLRLINAAMAQSSSPGDYKALVCIFLSGGNDSNNLIIPTIQTEYDSYASARGAVAIPLARVLPITPSNSTPHGYGFHPACPELQSLFAANKLATLFNVGTLVYPLTKAQYNANTVKKPPQLFSHSDQVTQWQTSIPDQAALTGWGGRCADLMNSVNLSSGGKISLATSLAGANTFEVGAVSNEYNVSTTGAVTMNLPGTTAQQQARQIALQNLLGVDQAQQHLQVQAYSAVLNHALSTGADLNAALAATPNSALFSSTNFPTTLTNPASSTTFSSSLMAQLQMVAKMIDASQSSSTANAVNLGMRRQIFFCQVGGYDTHTNQYTGVDTTTGAHSNLLAELSQCISRFQTALDGLMINGSPGSNSVTTFTNSDFGRTFPSNGQGSDHGWGSHHLIVGGAVQGGKTYGTWPTLAIGGPDDTSTGRWIPTTSVDQYAATLASWFGVTPSNLNNVFPNLTRFAGKLTFV